MIESRRCCAGARASTTWANRKAWTPRPQ